MPSTLTPNEIRERITRATAPSAPSLAGMMEFEEPTQRSADNWQDPIRAGLSYYRIPDVTMERGRIALLQNGANAMEMLQHRNYVLLSRYGGYKSANQVGDWQRNDPYLGIVQRGGVHEFDPEQVLACQWHFAPTRESTAAHQILWLSVQALIDTGSSREEAVVAVMPQLAGQHLDEHRCDFCPGRTFTTERNVQQHEQVMHREEVRSRETRDSVSAALAAGNSGNTEALAMIAEALKMLAVSAHPEPTPAPEPPKIK